MNPSSKSFDMSLMDIPHYRAYPMMLPFVGADYVSKQHSKLLILGESFYFPEESTWHQDASRWYSSSQTSLEEDEDLYINCRGLLECGWNSHGHEMYREINRCLAVLDLPLSERPVSHIAYTNTFMRPAHCSGGSFKDGSEEQDFVESIGVLTRVIATLTPDLVIFASKFAWDSVGLMIAQQACGTKFEFVSHPTTGGLWWYNKSYPHGKSKFISILRKWADSHDVGNQSGRASGSVAD